MNGLRPVAPMDAALALSVRPRAALRRARRHVFPSAPFLGLAARRVVRWSGAPGADAAFAWQLASRAPSTSSASPSTTTPAARVTREVLGVERLVERMSAAFESRSLAAAPSLVWAVRWREIHGNRRATYTRSATLIAPDGVRRRPASTPRSRVIMQPAGAARVAASKRLDVVRHTFTTSAVAATLKRPPADARAESGRATQAFCLPAPVNQQSAPANEHSAPVLVGTETCKSAASPTNARHAMAYDVAPLAPFHVPGRPWMGHRVAPVGATASWGAWALPVFRVSTRVPREPTATAAITAAMDQALPVVLRARKEQTFTQVLDAVTRAVQGRVAMTVHEEVAGTMETIARSQRTPTAAPPAGPPPVDHTTPPRVDERYASAMITGIRSLLREERFRHGLLG